MGVEAYTQLALKAAALLESVARFHPLIDGNKRSAWTLMVLLVWISSYRHDFGDDEGCYLCWAWPRATSICRAAPS